jgi:hypothetical protein
MRFFKVYPFQENVNFEYVDKYQNIYQLMSFNVYLLLFLPKNPSYKRKVGTARTSHRRPLTFSLN